jgi:protein-disulfide isomerase
MANSNFNFVTALAAGIIGAGLVIGVQYFTQAKYVEGTDTGDEFGTSVREYLLGNPDVIVEALQKHQANQEQAQLDEARQLIVQHKDSIQNNPNSPVVGNPAGDAVLVEFFDYNCGYCRRNAPEVKKLMAEDKGLRVVHKHLPILGAESVEAAKVVLAARLQNPAFYETIHNAFIAHEGRLGLGDIEKITRAAGANWEKILVDKESEVVKAEIQANYEIAQKLGLNGTPAFIVGTELMPGAQSYDQLKEAAAKTRSGAALQPAPLATPAAAAPAPVATPADAPADAAAPAPVEPAAPTAAAPAATPEAPAPAKQ